MVGALFGARSHRIIGIQRTAQSVLGLGFYLTYAIRRLFDCSILFNHLELVWLGFYSTQVLHRLVDTHG
jgi:hypothetical protein